MTRFHGAAPRTACGHRYSGRAGRVGGPDRALDAGGHAKPVSRWALKPAEYRASHTHDGGGHGGTV